MPEIWTNKMKHVTWGAAALGCLFLVSATFSTASAYNRKVTIQNKTRVPIVEFYASNTGTNNWQEDILGRDMLMPGQSVNINIDDGTGYCRYDFRAVFQDGDVLEEGGVNVCEVGTYTYR
jgi:hypothetical protein